MDETAKEALKMMKDLVEKLGITASDSLPHVLEHIRMQSYLRFVHNVVFMFVLVAITIAINVIAHKIAKRINSDENADESDRKFLYGLVYITTVFLSAGLVGGISSICASACKAYTDYSEPLGALIRSLIS